MPFEYVNKTLDKKALSALIDKCYREHRNKETVLLADRLRTLGFDYATRAGISICMDDMACSWRNHLTFPNCEHFASDSIVSSREARGSAGECGVERARSGGARDGCRWRYGEFAGGGRAVGPRQQRS